MKSFLVPVLVIATASDESAAQQAVKGVKDVVNHGRAETGVSLLFDEALDVTEFDPEKLEPHTITDVVVIPDEPDRDHGGPCTEIRKEGIWQWDDSGPDDDPGARLHLSGGIHVLGTLMHLEAYAIDPDKAEQSFAEPQYFEAEEAGFYALTGAAAQTTTINGREYVLVATAGS